MDKRTICKVLNAKHQDFLKSIKDEKVRELVAKNSLITGGSIVSMLLNVPVSDFDYYFTNKETCIAVAKYYIKQFNKAHRDKKYLTSTKLVRPYVDIDNETGRVKIVVPSAGITSEAETNDYQFFEQLPNEIGENFVDRVTKVVSEADDLSMQPLEDKEKDKYRVIFMSSNAITLSNRVQLVIRFYGEAEEIHKNFDFVHCQNYWIAKDNKLVLNQAALESILAKRLYYIGSLYPICSVIRTRKFIERGWRINAGQYLKMCFQVSQLDLENIDVLSEQLVGVDSSYFLQVIEWCKKKQTEDKDFKITVPYLCSVIDKIFG